MATLGNKGYKNVVFFRLTMPKRNLFGKQDDILEIINGDESDEECKDLELEDAEYKVLHDFTVNDEGILIPEACEVPLEEVMNDLKGSSVFFFIL